MGSMAWRMDDILFQLISAASGESLRGWTEPRMVERGEGYLGNVLEAAEVEGEGVVAKVRGTGDYFVHVFSDGAGGLEAKCSCPVHWRCKHAVAAVLRCAGELKEGHPLALRAPSSAFWQDARAAIDARRHAWEQDARDPEGWTAFRAQARATAERKAAQIREGTAAEERVFAEYLAELAARREEVLTACERGVRGDIFSAVDRFLSCMPPDEYPAGSEPGSPTVDCIDATMAEVLAALRKSGMGEADLIVWGIGLCDSDHFYVYDHVGAPVENLVVPPEDAPPAPEIWREVAVKLEKKIEDLCAEKRGEDGEQQMLGLLHALRNAWRRAGDEIRAADCWMRHATEAACWQKAADFLNRAGRFDDAIRIAREGIAVAGKTSRYGNDCADLLLEPLADAFSGKGDHVRAAAILAEQFLGWIGAYDTNRTVASFHKLLDEAEKAGVREEVRAAILHALKTGVNPEPLHDWPGGESVGYAAPDADPEPPPWPLPRAGEGIRHREMRWGTMWHWCQYDQEFLLKLALEKGDAEEIAMRFASLPEYPHSSMCYQREVGEMLAAVREKLVGVRDDLVEIIDHPRLHWSRPEDRPWLAASRRR